MEKINPVISRVTLNEINDITTLQLNNNNILLSESAIMNDLQNNNSIYYIARIKNIPIGYIAANLLYDHIDILGILVDTNYVRKGIATKLLSVVIYYSKSINVHDILLEVRKSNDKAQKLYEKFNFKQIGIRKQYYSNNLEDALIYKLSF